MSTTTEHPRRAVRSDPEAGGAPDPHPVWQRLESPLTTYYLLVSVIGVLLLIGLVMVLSASSVDAIKRGNPSYSAFLKQAEFAVIGVVAAVICSRLSVESYRRLAVPALVAAITLQMLVFSPLGYDVLGNRNWLKFGPITMQPSELGKVALVMFGAMILAKKRPLLHRWRHAIVPLVIPGGGLLVALVLYGSDLGTTLVLLAIIAGMLWAAGVSGRLFALAFGAAGALAGVLALLSRNRMDRIDQWLHCTDVQQCWQTTHGQWALADGGLLGTGLGGSREKWAWLPEPGNDFIFAIIGEELGIGGTLLVLALFMLLAFACYRVVLRSSDPFVRVATAGVMTWLSVQAMINIGAVIGLLPVIGLPLPLVSSGGSALVTTLIGLGMVVSFARNEPGCRRALAARPSLFSRPAAALAARRRGRSVRSAGAAR